jgi:hypothetical protein
MSCKKEYEISTHRYLELSHFCQQYHEYKAEIAKILTSGGGCSIALYAEKSRAYADSTAAKAIEVEVYRRYCDMIEQTAKTIGRDYGITEAIIKNVTLSLSYEQLIALEIIPRTDGNPRIGKNKFYQLRRKYFYLLAGKKK